MNEPTVQDYIEAAKVIGSCKIERLDAVIEIFKKCGINLSDSAISKAYGNKVTPEDIKTLSINEKRELMVDGKWSDSSDPVVIALRAAYINGCKVSDITKVANIPRTAFYDIIKGNRRITTRVRSQLIFALRTLNIPINFNSSDPSITTS